MYHFHLVSLFSVGINALLAAAVLLSNPKRELNRVLFGISLAIVNGNIGVYILGHTGDPAKAAFWFHQCTLGVFYLAPAFFHLSQLLSDQIHTRRRIAICYAISAILFIASFSGYGISSGRMFGSIYRNTGGPVFWIYYTWLACLLSISVRELFIVIRTANSPSVRLAKYVAVAFLTLGIGLLHDSLHVLGLNHYPGTTVAIMPFATLAASIYGLVLSHGLLSEQILDFRVSIGRNAAMLLRFSFLLGLSYLVLLSLGALLPGILTRASLYASLVSLAISTVVTIRFFPKLVGGLSDQLRRRIIGDRFEYHDKVIAFTTEHHSRTNSFPEFLQEAAELVAYQFDITAIGIATFDGDLNARGRAVRGATNGTDWNAIFAESSALRTLFWSGNQPYFDIREGPVFRLEERAALSLMRAQSLVVAFPISVDGRKPIGLLVVGSRKGSRHLTKLDVEVLGLLCHHIAVRAERIAVERNEELQRANQAKDQFLASVNHEIRNPLNGIHGIVQMLKEHCAEGRAQYLLETLQSCTDQLRTTMDDVLDFNRLGPEVAENHPVQVDLARLVRSITASYDLAGHQLIMEPVQRSLAEPGSQEPTIPVWCDSGKFSHILMNYLSNALKYGVPSGARVRIEGEAIDGGRARVKLTVTSTGPTLSKEEVLALFSPLTRGQRARETKAHGLGLGLALCKKLAHAMGGNVGVESAQGETTFWFVAELPIADPACPKPPQPALHVTPRLALAIEDEPYNRLVLGYHLNRFGITPVWAVDGQSAVAAAQDRAFDLIVMDWVLPDMDGEILLAKLREASPSPLPPIVVVSAYSTDSKRSAGLAAGAAAFVSKPIDEAKLAEALGECKLGSPIIGSTTSEPEPERIDLATLKKASADPGVVVTFLGGAEEVYSKLAADWEKNPHAAAASAHKLKGQMLLIRAKDCADLLDLLERALVDGRHPDDIERLMDAVQHSFESVTRSIRTAERLPSPNA